ncbi:MAG: alpha-amylase family protein [Micrococcales bacterium]
MSHLALIANAKEQLTKALAKPTRADLDLIDRFDRWGADLVSALADVYDVEKTLPGLIELMIARHRERDEKLQQRDRERVLQPDWFQSPDCIGYVAYLDLFTKDLKGLNKRIEYLKGLGATYLHLLPILEPRPGNSDGGYAVKSYRSLREDFGTMADLRATADKLHDAGISLTLDLVLNHVALEHEWAVKAKQGDAKYRDYFYIYPDRNMPDQYEATLPEVFPDFAPGNFTWDDEIGGWVWTTFNSFQWDVNWSNPNVFVEFCDIIANLANHGVDCLRLDAIAFIWKKLGTNCQNEPEVHALTQALRSFSRILSPALVFKAEAIVGPAQVGAYLGEGERAGKVSDLAYHNSLMVQIWSAIAAGDTGLLELAMSRFKAIPTNTAWGTYLRCHDDIGWAIDDSDAHRASLNGHFHRMFLADYYTGKFPMSDATGVDFQVEIASGERRTSGSGASLAGIETALKQKDADHLKTAINRFLIGYAMVFGFGGIPLLYMGDEIGLLNDHSFEKDPAKAKDNRWIHRPAMPWSVADKAAKGEDPESVATIIRKRIDALIKARKSLASLHAQVGTKVKAGRGQGVAIFERLHPAGNLIEVYNLSNTPRWVATEELSGLWGKVHEHIFEYEYELNDGFTLAPYEARWLTKS